MNYKTVLAVGAVAVVGYLFLKNEAKAAAKVVGEAIDPTSSDNIVYSGINAVGGVLSGEDDFDLGGWIYDITHPKSEGFVDLDTRGVLYTKP